MNYEYMGYIIDLYRYYVFILLFIMGVCLFIPCHLPGARIMNHTLFPRGVSLSKTSGLWTFRYNRMIYIAFNGPLLLYHYMVNS